MPASFRNDKYFLSNMFSCRITIDGVDYKCAEAAFQAFKLENACDRAQFSSLNGYEAKALGRRVKLRKDWEEIKLDVMREVVYQKFSQNKNLVEKLIGTEDELLVEENNCGDRFWGVCNGIGQNCLGKILKETKEKLKHE